jgi:hypothetical protein
MLSCMRRLPWYALGAAVLAASATHRLVPLVTRLAMKRRVPDRPGKYSGGASRRASVHGTLGLKPPTRALLRGAGRRGVQARRRRLAPDSSEADS